MNLPSETFCVLPWIHLGTCADGRVRQCCIAKNFINEEGNDHNLFHTPVEEIWNSNYMKKLRLDLLAGEKPKSCQTCWDKEENKSDSGFRVFQNETWSERVNIPEIVQSMKEDGTMDSIPIHWDLRLGNKCNLKCVMCSPDVSSLWAKDKEMIGKFDNLPKLESEETFDWIYGEEFWETLKNQLSNIKELW